MSLPASLEPEPSLYDAYQTVGGTFTSDDLIRVLREHFEQPISVLARRIVARELVSFSWCGGTYIPKFQFDYITGPLRWDVLILLAELVPALNDDEIARWFVQTNQWLAGDLPIVRMAEDFGAVLHAARTDRFVATS